MFVYVLHAPVFSRRLMHRAMGQAPAVLHSHGAWQGFNSDTYAWLEAEGASLPVSARNPDIAGSILSVLMCLHCRYSLCPSSLGSAHPAGLQSWRGSRSSVRACLQGFWRIVLLRIPAFQNQLMRIMFGQSLAGFPGSAQVRLHACNAS